MRQYSRYRVHNVFGHPIRSADPYMKFVHMGMKTSSVNCIIGEASAGKSSLINELLGLKLVKVSKKSTSDTIYRVHKGEELRLICTSKEGKELQNSTFGSEESLKSALKKVDLPEMLYVDIFLPKSTLKVIVNNHIYTRTSKEISGILLLPWSVRHTTLFLKLFFHFEH